jgi:hypothetical protein
MRDIFIYYIYVIAKQVGEYAISYTSEKQHVNLYNQFSSHPMNLR